MKQQETKTYIPKGHPILEKYPEKITDEDSLLELLQPLADKFLSVEIKETSISSNYTWLYFRSSICFDDDRMIRFCCQMTKKSGYVFGKISDDHDSMVIVHQTNLDYWN